MKTLDLDTPLKPMLTVTIEGVKYPITDVDPSLATSMTGLADAEGNTEAAMGELYDHISKVVGAPKEAVAKLGLRKINLLIRALFTAVREETDRVEEEVKNVPVVDAKTSS